ncbi:putative ABC transport system ATP-binding protein [Nonomuraea thailandensis]|uniref:ABC transport system ATP-binding protein n=1 Tax=Nonomuraea thailandensis TaxID=1188745 RepID=A0A9X2GG81_9ACTN|nr:ABC transporter ATP-binding protein [Nonomuraea thailandensis]MCP2353518.1 putative ABC transport system ATP-binding protein [Nonomuraea thailandensis]
MNTGIEPAVRLDRIGKVYGTGPSAVTALKDVSHAFARGSFTAVMGPSGSGKTSLLQCSAGLTQPTSGTVSVGGTDLTALTEAELAIVRRERVGFVFQGFNLLPALTAKENIELPMRLAGKRADQAWVRELVGRTGIAEHVHRRPHELSGGQQQRVAICRALVAGPEVVFADEPTGSLDTRSGQEILAMLRLVVGALKQTVILVTHDATAAAYADRVLFIRDGEVVDVMEEPTPDRVAASLSGHSGSPGRTGPVR